VKESDVLRGSCQSEATRQIVSVRAGTLDGDPSLRPSVHAYTTSKAPWFEICDGVPQASEDGR
jgi:hypothetical protein